jgi:hypothetical protein
MKFTIYNEITRDANNILSAIMPDGISLNESSASIVFDCLSKGGTIIAGNKPVLIFLSALMKKNHSIVSHLYKNNLRGSQNPEGLALSRKIIRGMFDKANLPIEEVDIKKYVR